MVFPINGPSNYHILLMDYSCISFILQGNYLASKSPTSSDSAVIQSSQENTSTHNLLVMKISIPKYFWDYDMIWWHSIVMFSFNLLETRQSKDLPSWCCAGWEEAKHLPQLTHLAVMRSEIMIWLCSSSSTIAEITVWEGRSCITAQPGYPVWLWTGITL